MNDIVIKATALANMCADRLGFVILDVEYVKENGIKILRIIGDVKDESDTFDIDKATLLNNLISEELDKEDFINEEYYLEVSSMGLEAELKKDVDIIKSIGKYICIKTYEKISLGQKKLNSKEIYGDLISYENGIIKMEVMIVGKKNTLEIEKEKISKIRLAVKF